MCFRWGIRPSNYGYYRKSNRAATFPARAHNEITTRLTAVVIAGHLERYFPIEPGTTIINCAGGIVIQNVICASSRDDAFESAAYADRVMVVTHRKNRWSSGCKEEHGRYNRRSDSLHLRQIIAGQRIVCLYDLTL